MRLTERIVDAGNSPPKTINSFEELKYIRPMDVVLDGRKIGRGQVGTLPYGAGYIIKFEDQYLNSCSHWPFNGDGVRVEPRKRFRKAKFPVQVNFMD